MRLGRTLSTFLLVTALLAAGCAADPPEGRPSGGGRVFEPADDLALLVSGPVDGTSDAAFPGVLAVVDGCLGIEIGGTGHPVVWPEGMSAAEGDEPGLVTPDGTEVGLGDEVEGGGGSVAADELPASAPELPDSCADTDEVAVLGTVEVP